jgi:hypothetical protein
MAETTAVGAGLSGLVAAINLARRAPGDFPDDVKRPLLRFGLTVVPFIEHLAMMIVSANTPGWRVAAKA